MACDQVVLSRAFGNTSLALHLPLTFVDTVDEAMLADATSSVLVLEGEYPRLVFGDDASCLPSDRSGLTLTKPVNRNELHLDGGALVCAQPGTIVSNSGVQLCASNEGLSAVVWQDDHGNRVALVVPADGSALQVQGGTLIANGVDLKQAWQHDNTHLSCAG